MKLVACGKVRDIYDFKSRGEKVTHIS